MKIGKAFGKLHFLAIDRDRAIGGLFALHALWQIIAINRQEPAHIRALAFQETGRTFGRFEMVMILQNLAEYKAQHIEEMNTDIGGHTA